MHLARQNFCETTIQVSEMTKQFAFLGKRFHTFERHQSNQNEQRRRGIMVSCIVGVISLLDAVKSFFVLTRSVSFELQKFTITSEQRDQVTVSGIFRGGGILDNKKLLSRNYLFNFRATLSPANDRASACSENSIDWRSAFRVHVFL